VKAKDGEAQFKSITVWNAVGAIAASDGHLEPRDTLQLSTGQGKSYPVAQEVEVLVAHKQETWLLILLPMPLEED